jgi:spore maturation protein CgeB
VRIFFAVPRSAWVDVNLRRSLEDMGHQLVRFDFPGWPDDADPAWQRAGKPRTNERLLEAFRAARRTGPLDLFFGYFYSSVVYPETIDLIRGSGVPTVNFSCNNVHQFHLVRDIAPRFDVCVVPEAAAQQDFRAVGATPVRIQLAANPRVYRPYPEPRVYDVTFVGQRYADRADLLSHLRSNAVDVRAWGAGWQPIKRLDVAHARAALALVEDERFDGLARLLRRRLSRSSERSAMSAAADEVDTTAFGRSTRFDAKRLGRGARPTRSPVPADEVDTSAFGGPRLLQRDLIRMFSRSRISLGFATAGDSHVGERRLTHLRLREFEAPMCGALYLTEEQPELAEYFESGKEVLTYTDRDELLAKVRYYLSHQEQAERIRRAGLERARREHTWQHRFRQLFAALGLESST